ncbi:MAG: 2OG-Fe dioxygenase family protein [Burkholderiales bacterium]|nr:2OG-Fe dioxygenase family protein [Burkholderiales bacterium]
MKSLREKILHDGFCFVPAAEARSLLGETGDWPAFEASWNNMPLDTYMADGGRYRRRRHATLSVAPFATHAKLEAHQPHYQSLDYNNLNGGIARHFEPINTQVIDGVSMSALLSLCIQVFGSLAPGRAWHVEVHQFRIEAGALHQGMPTPEGVHRDGVDYVMVLMVKRHNIAEGTTTIHDRGGRQLASFTLTQSLDMTLVDDERCLHGVTPVVPIDPASPAYRDVLVATFRATQTPGNYPGNHKESP